MRAYGWRDRMVLLAPFAAVAFLAMFTPTDDGPKVCPFALCTGMACPGCGMTRAASYLIRGDLRSAITYHPLAPLIVVELLAAWVWWFLGRRSTVRPMSTRAINALLIANAAVLIVVWALRLTHGSLPPV